mgnify:CR=1 FL=1
MDTETRAEPAPPVAAPCGEMLAYVEGFLLGLARRLDDSSSGQFYKAAEAADDCRAVAKTIGRIRIPMDRPQPPTQK